MHAWISLVFSLSWTREHVYVCIFDVRSLHLSLPFSFKDRYIYLFAVFCLHVSLQARRGCRISLQMIVNHHVVAWNWTQDLWKSSQCSSPLFEPSLQPERSFILIPIDLQPSYRCVLSRVGGYRQLLCSRWLGTLNGTRYYCSYLCLSKR